MICSFSSARSGDGGRKYFRRGCFEGECAGMDGNAEYVNTAGVRELA
jgi:hypothetical protein